MNMPGDWRPFGSRPALALVVALVATCAASPVLAQVGPLTAQTLFFDQASNSRSGNYVDLQAGMVYTDNVDLTRNGTGDTLAVLGLAADTSRQGPRLEYHLNSDISFVKYLKEEFQTRPYGYLDGDLAFKIIPGFFSWTARETYVDAVIIPTQAATPDNLEGINFATTGPRFTLRPTLRTTIVINGSYSYIDSNSQSPLYVNIDNRRYAGDATINQALSNTTSVYLGGSWQKVNFVDDTINTNFTEEQGTLGYKYADARTVLDVSGGYAKLRVGPQTTTVPVIGGQTRQQTIDESPSGATYRLELSRLISPTQRVSFHALQQVADAANMFRLDVDGPVVSVLPQRVASGDPFTNREFGLDYRFQASRTSLDIALFDISERYKVNPTSNRDIKGANALLARQLTPVLNWEVGLDYQRQNYNSTTGALNQISAITSLRWQLGQRFGLRFIYAHASLNPHRYDENQVGITVSYALVGTPQTNGVGSPLLLPTSPMSPQYPAQMPLSPSPSPQ